MKLHEIKLFENDDDPIAEEQTPSAEGTYIVTEPQLKELFSKYVFAQYNMSPEYSHECEVAAIIDVPASITEKQKRKLFLMANMEDIIDYGYDIFGITYEQVTTDYDPGTSVWDREDLYNIHLVKFADWADNAKASLKQDDDFGE